MKCREIKVDYNYLFILCLFSGRHFHGDIQMVSEIMEDELKNNLLFILSLFSERHFSQTERHNNVKCRESKAE